MKIDPKTALDRCETLMLDMDGTVLDLAFDHYIWMQRVPEQYAVTHGVDIEHAREKLYEKFNEMIGQLEWYCLDYWSEFLGLDVVAIHREHNHRIGYLPGAEDFLRAVCKGKKRLLLVSNSHAETLAIKNEVTGVAGYFDGIHLSHEFGHPKETRLFWEALADVEDFDPATTLFIDDTARVLSSAADFGVSMLLQVSNPDTSAPPRRNSEFAAVGGVKELL